MKLFVPLKQKKILWVSKNNILKKISSQKLIHYLSIFNTYSKRNIGHNISQKINSFKATVYQCNAVVAKGKFSETVFGSEE